MQDEHNSIHALIIVVSFLFTAIYLLVAAPARTIKNAATAFIVGVPVGWLAGFFAYEHYDKLSVALVVTGVASLVARSLVIAIINGGEDLKKNVFSWVDLAVRNMINKRTK